jgi:hypothetical protein
MLGELAEARAAEQHSSGRETVDPLAAPGPAVAASTEAA